MSSEPPLVGLRVLEIANHFAAPGAAMLLSDYGADVVKIELPDGDPARSFPPCVPGTHLGEGFLALNRGKRSAVIDWRTDAGRAAVDRLIQGVDVLVAYRPRNEPASAWPFHYSHLKELNPRLIYATITPFGRTGRYAALPGYEPLIQSLSGVMGSSRTRDGKPVHTGFRVGESAPAMLLAHGIMMALLAREKTGKGQLVDTSMLQAAIAAQSVQLSWADDDPAPVTELPQATVQSYLCADDRYINIITIQERQWNAMCRVLGLEHLVGDPEYSSGEARSRRRVELYSVLDGILGTRSSWDWLAVLHEAGVPCGPTLSRDELFTDPQIVQNGYALTVRDPDGGLAQVVGSPISMSETPARPGVQVPGLGEHTRAVLADAGFSSSEVALLAAAKVIP